MQRATVIQTTPRLLIRTDAAPANSGGLPAVPHPGVPTATTGPDSRVLVEFVSDRYYVIRRA